MPIKGLTDRGLSFPEIGQIRKGAKKTENRPGADLTYFRVEFDEKEQKTAEAFQTAYSEKPAYIRIILPFNEIDRMWDAWYEAYTAGRMVARSDGEFITYQLDDNGDMVVKNGLDANGNKVPHPVDGIAGHDYKGKPVLFKATGRLKVIIPELSRAAYLTVMTTSIHDIANVSAQLGAFKELNNGQLAGIPFILRRRPKSISTPGENGQRVRRTKSLISIEADPKWVQAKLGEMKTLAMPDTEALLLPANVEQVEAMSEYEPDEDELSDGWEEGIYEEVEEQPNLRAWTLQQKQAIVDSGYAENIHEAGNMLNKSTLKENVGIAIVQSWAKYYRAARDENKSYDDAAQIANDAYEKSKKR